MWHMGSTICHTPRLSSAKARFAAVAPFVPEADEQTDFERYYIESKPIGRLSVQKV